SDCCVFWANARAISTAERAPPASQTSWGNSMNDDDRPFVIERAGPKGRIRLNAAAKYWAQEYGMSLTEMGKYLLAQDQQAGGQGQSGSAGATEDFLPDVTLAVANDAVRRHLPVARSACSQLGRWWLAQCLGGAQASG